MKNLLNLTVLFIFALTTNVFASDKSRVGYNVVSSGITGGRNSFQGVARMPTIGSIGIGNSISNIGNIKGNDPVQEKVKDELKRQEKKYTVKNCMNSLLACINGGALPNGLNDLFNTDMLLSVLNGMGLCSAQVDKCLDAVSDKGGTTKVYMNATQVWQDFNTRVIMPEYYSFVLRKTGLTPHQAETVCWLLDKNAYGSSFTRVESDNSVKTEARQSYEKEGVSFGKSLLRQNSAEVPQYNHSLYEQGIDENGSLGILTSNVYEPGPNKDNPMGSEINTNVKRGHYARWDAVKAECLIRVAAYNKDTFITNDWLFGALGDKKPAEVWKKAGDVFTCSKDLFGFSLMNQTSTVAVVGIGGGTAVGAGVGAIVGHGDRGFDCKEESQRKTLFKELYEKGKLTKLNNFLSEEYKIKSEITEEACNNIYELYKISNDMSETDIMMCKDSQGNDLTLDIKQKEMECNSKQAFADLQTEQIAKNEKLKEAIQCQNELKDLLNKQKELTCYKALQKTNELASIKCDSTDSSSDCLTSAQLKDQLVKLKRVMKEIEIFNGEKSNRLKTTLIGAGIGAGAGSVATAITAFVEKNNINCRVGDGLEKVALGKSHSIGSLKDFFVKWNLQVPEKIISNSNVDSCDSWKTVCSSINDLNTCRVSQIKYTKQDGIITLFAPCVVNNNRCEINQISARSHGACTDSDFE